MAAIEDVPGSSFQAPPLPLAALHRDTGGPPATATFFSLPSGGTKKPMNLLSGDQKG